VVVSNHNNSCTVFDGSLLQKIDDTACRILVERSSRLIGENQLGAVHKRAGDRDALPLAPRQGPRLVVDPVSKPEAIEDRSTALSHLARRAVAELHRHFDVFVGRQRIEQIVHLEDKADITSHRDQLTRAEVRQAMPEHLDRALLHGAERSDKGQQGGFAGPRRSGHHDELPCPDLYPIVEQHLVARLTLPIEVIQAVHPYRWM
jgi:hypothetical protein